MSDTVYRFYSNDIDIPLSDEFEDWDSSRAKKLNDLTDGQVYVHTLEGRQLDAEYAWKVVEAEYLQEDGLISYFRAYDEAGHFIPEATFGVHYNTNPHRISTSKFKYPPKLGNQFYVPIQNNFVTYNTGGYTVQVLNLDYPSEGLSFGMFKQGDLHQALLVSFRLFKL